MQILKMVGANGDVLSPVSKELQLMLACYGETVTASSALDTDAATEKHCTEQRYSPWHGMGLGVVPAGTAVNFPPNRVHQCYRVTGKQYGSVLHPRILHMSQRRCQLRRHCTSTAR
jgi:hypothetical protein